MRDPTGAARFIRAYGALRTFNIVAFSMTYIVAPWLRPSLSQEDGVIENLSAALFALGFMVGVCALCRNRHLPRGSSVIPLISLMGFLDELSWGERLFAFSVPYLYGVDIDAVHDLVRVVWRLSRAHPLASALFCGGLIGGLLSMSTFRGRVKRPLLRLFDRGTPTAFLRDALIFIAPAVIIDAAESEPDFVRLVGQAGGSWRGLVFLEELLELNGALALLFGAIALSRVPAREAPTPTDHGGAASLSRSSE